MTRTNVAALALLAGVAIAAPALVCSAADTEMQTAQAQTTAQPPQGAQTPSDQQGQGMPGMGGMRGMMGREGREGHRGWMREAMNRSPRERCEDRLARRAGVIAYTVTKLNLTAQQKPLWDKVNTQIQANADKERQICAKLPNEAGQQGQETFLDRLSRREQFLEARLQAMQATRPAVEALYNALSPEQKAVLDHPFRR